MARGQQQTLALTAASHIAAEDSLIDALPYIDPLTPDIKKEVEAEKKEKAAAGPSQQAVAGASGDTWEFMGLQVKPPQALLGITSGFSNATRRVETVIADEVSISL